MPERVEELARAVLHDVGKSQIGQRHAATADVDQGLVFVGREDGKLVAIRQLVQVRQTVRVRLRGSFLPTPPRPIHRRLDACRPEPEQRPRWACKGVAA